MSVAGLAGLEYAETLACTASRTRLTAALEAMNSTRASMYRSLGSNPGMFPHIFIDQAHQWNNTWAALLRTLCQLPQADSLPACGAVDLTVSFTLVSPLTARTVLSRAAELAAAVSQGVDYSASRSALPVNYETPSEPGGAPSYVNVLAVKHSALERAVARGAQVQVQLSVTVLAGMAEACREGLQAEFGAKYVSWALRVGGFGNQTIARDVRVV
eukprot:TRINITY_DN33293_c0_g1_i1.p1 TRINITY_DN33293_c0_g1~~TRINITY_DN33293_c0_g1_i1.p1  ORF type:complete len:215 (+),score=58.52 TRINITY_DN33293_c0_g1_i1:359-1003(+)